MRAILVRLFGGYGPRHNLTWWGGPQSGFITKAFKGEELEIHGDGMQTRSFTYISDHIEGFFRMLKVKDEGCQVLNLGSNHEISILDLGKKIWSLIRDDEPKIKMVPYASFGKYQDVQRRIPEQSKMREKLGFVPNTKLEDGLKITIEWQRKKLGIA